MAINRFDQGSVAWRSVIFMACMVIILAAIKSASDIMVPFLLAMFLSIICNPLVQLLMKARLPRALAIFTVMAIVILLGVWLGSLVGASITDFRGQLPTYREQLTEQLQPLVQYLAQFNINLSTEQVKEQFDPGRIMGLATDILSSLGGLMANTLLIVLAVVFMLFEASGISRKLHFALDDPQMRLQQIDRFLDSVNRYLAIKTLVSLFTGIVVGVGLFIIGVDYFLLWGLVAFLFNYIPNIGSIIAAVPAVALAFLQFGVGGAAATAAVYVGSNMVMGNVVEPRMMGRTLGLSTLVVFLSLIFWGWLLGSVGMLLSVPLTMIVKIALESSDDGRWLAVLLEGEPQIVSQPMQGQSFAPTDKDPN
ncbi:AI-2E family transporter [uncultured Ferrimonas sp.]|uniref:AI-2E family transporter n=1 Tax=uncultured Ferrimonas sp. TaxID=432640 RepID=UPI00260FFC16|nr:AI-2E family transporter [uncultured Ferrimonas sp.]